jgi:hypothetical protein
MSRQTGAGKTAATTRTVARARHAPGDCPGESHPDSPAYASPPLLHDSLPTLIRARLRVRMTVNQVLCDAKYASGSD